MSAITEKQIQDERRIYMSKNFAVNNSEAKKANDAYLAGVRMALEKTGRTASCDRDCPDAEYGNCCHPSDCCKFYF